MKRTGSAGRVAVRIGCGGTGVTGVAEEER